MVTVFLGHRNQIFKQYLKQFHPLIREYSSLSLKLKCSFEMATHHICKQNIFSNRHKIRNEQRDGQG
jgi:hypothetical protein